MFDIKKLKEDPTVNLYSKKSEIDAVLRGFHIQKKSLILYPVPFNNEYATNIIKLTENYITIDSLMPKKGNLEIIESSYLKLSFKFHDNEHFFLSKLEDFKKNNDFFTFDIYKPVEILSLEKRKFFRIEPSLNEPVRLSFFLNNKYFSANVFDIAGEGISFLLNFPIEKHTVIEGVKMEFPADIPPINIRMEIRSSVQMNNLKYKIGAQMINLKSKEQDIMFRYIFKRQREIVAAMKGM